MIKEFVFVFVSLLIIISPLSANKLAILIGNQNYDSQNSLRTPQNEIDLIGMKLKDYGFETLTYYDVNLKELYSVIDTLEKKLPQTTLLYVHYTGHGAQIDGQNFLIPVDVDPWSAAQLKRQSLALNVILELIEREAKNNGILETIICLDACRNNPFFLDDLKLKEGLAGYNNYLPPNTGLVFSTAPGYTSIDGVDSLSPFAEVWLGRLNHCSNSILDIFSLIQGDILEMNIPSSRRPYIRFSGLADIFFCPNHKKDGDRNSKLNLAKSLYDSASIDYKSGDPISALDKLNWIDSLSIENESLASEKLWLDDLILLKADCYTSVNQIDNAIELLKENDFATRTLQSFNRKIFYQLIDLYFRNSICHKAKEYILETLNNYPNLFKDNIEVANLFDKVAGCHDYSNELDSALVFYNLAINQLDTVQPSLQDYGRSEHIYSNYGNCLTRKMLKKQGRDILLTAWRHSTEFGLDRDYLLLDIIQNISSIDTYDEELYPWLKKLEYSVDQKEIHDNWSLKVRALQVLYTTYATIENDDKAFNYFKILQKQLQQKYFFKIHYVGVPKEDYLSKCTSNVVQFEIELTTGVLPEIFLDLDGDDYYSDGDYIIAVEPQEVVGKRFVNAEVNEQENIDLIHYSYRENFRKYGLVNVSKKCPTCPQNVKEITLNIGFYYEFVPNRTIWTFHLPIPAGSVDMSIDNLSFSFNLSNAGYDGLTCSPDNKSLQYFKAYEIR